MRTILVLTVFTLLCFSLQSQRLLPVLIDESNLHLPNQFPADLSGNTHLANINGGLKVFQHSPSLPELRVYDLVGEALVPDETYEYEFGEVTAIVRVKRIDGLTFVLGRPNNGVDPSNILKVRVHDGESWTLLGQVPLMRSFDVARFNDEWLICGRPFEGQPAIWRWDGENWQPFDAAFTQEVYCMEVYEEQLFVGGSFDEEGGAPVNYLARLTENGWESVGQGVNNVVNAMTIYDGQILIGGSFTASTDETLELPPLVTFLNDELTSLPWIEEPVWTVRDFTHVGNRVLVTFGNITSFGITKSLHIEDNAVYQHDRYTQRSAAYVFPTYYYNVANNLNWNVHYNESTLYRERSDGQTHSVLQNSQLKTDYTAFASQFNRPDYSTGFITTQGSDFENGIELGLIYNTSFWYSGVNNDNVHGAYATYNVPWNTDETVTITYGPYSECYDRGYLNRYYRVWYLTREMIETHQAQFANPNYTMPEAIENYPGNGRSWCNESSLLASFEDLNENGLYEPELGEYPIIHGDKSVITLTNDRMRQNEMSPGIEIVSEYFMYDTDDPDIAHTVFLHAQIRNRSGRDYEDFAVGYFADTNIGLSLNDYVGSAPQGNYFYGYNGTFTDFPDFYPEIGYGYNIPSIGFKFLNRPLDAYMFYNNGANPVTGEPFTGEDVHNYLHSRWKDGSPLLQGGMGSPSNSWTPPEPATHHYPDFPWNTDEGHWNEVTAGNAPQYRRSVGAAHIPFFADRSSVCLDIALVVAFPADSMEQFNEVAQLDARIPLVEQFYESLDITCQWEVIPLSVDEEDSHSSQLKVFPNPSNGHVNFQSEIDRAQLYIYDLSGKVEFETLYTGQQKSFDLSHLAPGLYICQLVLADRSTVSTRLQIVR